MKTNKVTQATPLSKTEALIKAKQLVGSAANTILIGDQVDTSIKQKHEQKVASEAISLMRQSEMKVVTQANSAAATKSSTTGKTSSDPLDTLSRVEEENNTKEKNDTDDALAQAHQSSQRTASYYILTSKFKSMSSKFVSMFRSQTKSDYKKTAIYLLEKATSVGNTGGTSAS